MLIIDNTIAFVHMQKCGGSTFCWSLINGLDEERCVYYGYTEKGESDSARSLREGGLWKHSTTSELKAKTGASFGSMAVYFLADRDPWSRTASWYFYAKHHNERDPERYKILTNLSFENYIESRHFPKAGILDYICDVNGSVIPNVKIIRFGDLEAEFVKVCRRHNFGDIPMTIRNQYHGGINYFSLYNEKTYGIVEEHFKDEINFFKNKYSSMRSDMMG